MANFLLAVTVTIQTAIAHFSFDKGDVYIARYVTDYNYRDVNDTQLFMIGQPL